MEPIVVDTSVWIDFIRQSDTSQVRLLIQYLQSDDTSLYITPTILQEVLQGIREDSLFTKIEANLTSLGMLKLESVDAAIEAAQLFRFLRKKGIIIRKPNDCLIAHYAIFYDIPLLRNDIDFDQIARFSGLRFAIT